MSPIKHRVQVFPAFRQSGELRIRKKTNNTQTIKGTGGGRLIPCSISVRGGGAQTQVHGALKAACYDAFRAARQEINGMEMQGGFEAGA